MERLVLGNTAIKASRICLGTGGFGTSIPRSEAFALMDELHACGGNFIDTAHVYAAWRPGGVGASERTIGDWLKSRGLRNEFIVATKGGHPPVEAMSKSRIAPGEIAKDLSESLERLQIDSVDLYWLHRDDPKVPVAVVLRDLWEHLEAGRVGAIGASNWQSERLAQANSFAQRNGLVGFCASQVGWSLAKIDPFAVGDPTMLYMNESTWAYHQATNLAVVAYSSQAGGFFGGKYEARIGADAPLRNTGVVRQYFSRGNFARLQRAKQLAQHYGCSANQVAIAYLLSQPFPVYPIVGCRTVEQVRDSFGAADLRLTPEEVGFLSV